MNAKSQPSNAPAKKYCFKATTTMYRKGRPIGKFIGYDYRIIVAGEVEKACQKQCISGEDGFCDPVELTVLEECPIELRDEIYFEFLH